MALSAELCERALFTFGRVATSLFRQDVENGRARLSFRRPENRQFWLAGYHYLKSLIRKGTYRTALEWAKLLYAVDHSDPYGMRHFIQFLAVRAYESRWFVDLMEELEGSSSCADLIYTRQTLVLAKLQLGDTDGAEEELVRGLHRLPWLYCTLFQELGFDAPPSIWGISPETSEQEFWTKLYIYQTKELWNNPPTCALLQDTAKTLDKVDRSALTCKEAVPDLAAVRLVYLEGQTSILAVAPRELLQMEPNYEFDPMPPPEEENVFSGGEGGRLPWTTSRSDQRQQTSEIVRRMQRVIGDRQQAAQLARLNAAEGGDGDEIEENWSDDEELRRDLEEAAGRAIEPNFINAIMDMLGMRTRPATTSQEDEEDPHAGEDEDENENGDGDHGQVTSRLPEDQSQEEEADGQAPAPGAWPSE